MKISNAAVTKVGWRVTRVVLVAVAVGVGAETFQQGGSTTTIEQSGGRGPSYSQVIRDPDGQTIITQDGNSTDITVQRRSGAPSSDDWESPPASVDRFDRGGIDQRFSRRVPKRGNADDGSDSTGSSLREAFKQQLLERLHRPAP